MGTITLKEIKRMDNDRETRETSLLQEKKVGDSHVELLKDCSVLTGM